MIAFQVKKGTVVHCIEDGKEWAAPNIREHETVKDNLFFLEELIVDPTGISRTACIPNCVTIGSAYAGAGFYGFRRDGWSMLVRADQVFVNGREYEA